ncbi:MAG: RNA-guided endonuclease IscB, partial [Chloroflexota bacterium]|nr:RNA-guided endonuclease IscB [Chloroflexota bacterium]
MSNVFVLDTNTQPLNPVHPGRARTLLSRGQAAVFRRYPFTIILHAAVEQPVLEPLRLKLDPGSRTTGIALLNDASGQVVWAGELTHRGHAIKAALDARRSLRRSRRQRKTRYRKPRFNNRKRKQGMLPPSLESRIATTETWVQRLVKVCPIAAISQELVKFDTHALQAPELTGIAYQQGELAGYEVREYLLQKWNRTCAYCGANTVPLQIEHILARARGGTDRVSNLTLACEPCNQKKGTQDIRNFLTHRPAVLSTILAQAKAPLKDVSAVNATRWALYERLRATGLSVECGTGGRTKYNRVSRGLEKAHWLDAACVGASTPEVLTVDQVSPLLITATGHGRRQMCGTNRYGVPIRHRTRQKHFYGFQTGDMV